MNQVDLSVEEDALPTPQMNIIKSVIDTLVSKIASTKVRPYFTPVNGDYTTIKVLKQLQIYFDDLFDRQDIVKKVTSAFRDACIFDTGYLFINPFGYGTEAIRPWQVSVLDSEYHYGELTKALLYFYDFPDTLLKKQYGVAAKSHYVNLELYFDTEERKLCLYADNVLVKESPYTGPVPLVFLQYCTPLKGLKTTSIVDDLYNIQLNIDLINARIKEAAELSPANMIFVPDGTNITVEMLNNRSGNVIKYKPLPGAGAPVDVAAPPFISSEYRETLEYNIQKAYEMAGISTLSAQSINPLGANASGAALQSMENIESTRFETQLNQVVRSYVDLAKLMIAMYPDDADILPEESNRSGYKWKDIKKQSSLINIQYSAQTMLSKDPATRFKQILQLSQVGIIPQSKIGRFLDQPDLNEVYSLATASQDAVDKVIQMAVENGIFEIPKFVSYALLEETITAMQNQLLGAVTPDSKGIPKALAALQTLDDQLQEIMVREGFTPVAPEGPIQVSEEGIGAAGAVEAPSSVDAVNNFENAPGTENEKNQWGDV
jgi:hypothetical protein